MCENSARMILELAVDASRSKDEEEILEVRNIILLNQKEFKKEVEKHKDEPEVLEELEPFLDLIW